MLKRHYESSGYAHATCIPIRSHEVGVESVGACTRLGVQCACTHHLKVIGLTAIDEHTTKEAIKTQDESLIPEREPHKAELKEGLHSARIAEFEVLKDQPGFQGSKPRNVIRYTFDVDGSKVRKSYTLTSSDMGSLHKLFKKLLNVDIAKEKGHKGSELKGLKCQVEIEHRTTDDGSEWDRITNAMALPATFEDDENDPRL